MGPYGKLSVYTDEEILQLMTDNRMHSPVIEELCQRLEIKITKPFNETNHRVECPVCEAQLEADIDIGNNMFTLELWKE